MKLKSKYNLLFELLMKQVITVDTFDYKFNNDDLGNLECEFKILQNDKLKPVIAKIDTNKNIIFLIDNGKKLMSEKTFMIKFYKDYTMFKLAYTKYIDKTNKVLTKLQSLNISSTNLILPFSKKLHDLKEKTTGESIKINNTFFYVRKYEDDIKNLMLISFTLINNNADSDELPKYKVISILKLKDKNSIPVKFLLINPETNESVQLLSRTQFKEKYLIIYDNLIEAADHLM